MARKDAVERDRRRQMVRSVAHSSAMDGLPLDSQMMERLYAVADGTMTSDEVRALLLKKYEKVTKGTGD